MRFSKRSLAILAIFAETQVSYFFGIAAASKIQLLNNFKGKPTIESTIDCTDELANDLQTAVKLLESQKWVLTDILAKCILYT